MHVTLALFITAAAFWAVLPVKLVAIAGTVYVLVQALKQIFPSLGGWQSIALNVALSVTGVLAVAKPGDLESSTFWASLMITVASAAGIHGTVKSVAERSLPQMDTSKAKMLALLFVFGLVLGLSGCGKTVTATTPAVAPPLPAGAVDAADAKANMALQPAHAFAASISADILSGKLATTPNQKLAMESLNRALNVADKAEITYHATGGGNQAALNAAVAAVLQAWASTQGALTPAAN